MGKVSSWPMGNLDEPKMLPVPDNGTLYNSNYRNNRLIRSPTKNSYPMYEIHQLKGEGGYIKVLPETLLSRSEKEKE